MTDDTGGGTQIPLAFSKYDQIDFDLFEPGENQPVLTQLQLAVSGSDRKNVYLWGRSGSGKSHLLQAVCTAAANTQQGIAYIPLHEAMSLSPHMLDGLETLSLVCLDDVDAIAGNAVWEEAIFHLYNRLRDAGIPLLMTALHSPMGSPVELADLKSRLSWDHVFRLLPLSEQDTLRALKKRATSRGFELPPEVAEYLIVRVARDMHSLFSILDRLDKASLIAKKKLSVPFVRALLD